MRLANIEKAGYFPTPPVVTQLIASHIAPATHPSRTLDPCAGTGTALVTLTDQLNSQPYGVELHANRAEQLRQLLPIGQALHTDYRHLKISSDSFNLLFLNPPYLRVEDKEIGRAEYQWLLNTRPFLQPDGLLIYLIPAHILAHKQTATYLAAWYRDLAIYRFPAGEYERFKQVVVFGRRRDRRHHPDPELTSQLHSYGRHPLTLPELTQAEQPTYPLPPLTKQSITFTSRFIDPADALAEATAVGIASGNAFNDHLFPTSAEQPLSPLMPLKIGHMNAIIAAGHLNNQLLVDEETDERFLIKGRTYKQVVEATTETELDNGHRQKETTRTDIAITDITTLTPEGTITAVKNDELEPFLSRWLPQLTAIVANAYPPRYQFDLNGYAPILDRLNQGRIIPNTTMRGLLPAQRHAAAAIATQLQTSNNAILVGEMGVGKTIVGTAIAALLQAKHSIVLCPPHLVQKWVREIEITWPAATAVPLQTIADVDAFFAQPGPIIGVLKETAARSASGWHHAFDFYGPATMPTRSSKQPWQLQSHSARAPKSQKAFQDRLAAPTTHKQEATRSVRCPHCGGNIYDKHGNPTTPAHFQNAQQTCANCNSPLYQDSRRYSQDELPQLDGFKHHIRADNWIRRTLAEPDSTLKRITMSKWIGRTIRNGGYARYPLASYINRHYKRRLDLLVGDESHQFKAADSDRGYAFHRLVVAAKKTVAMTGTIYGGKASNLFHLLYRLVPEMAAEWHHNDVSKWVDRYGIMQEVERRTYDQDGKLTGNSKDKTTVKELPGGTPDMLPWLLNRSVFMSLSDMGFALPNYEEIPVTVQMTPTQQAMYDDLQTQLLDKMRDRLLRGDRSLLGAYLQALLCWPDSPWRPKVVRDPKLRDERQRLEAAQAEIPDDFDLIARVPGLPDDCFYPKEERILELIQSELAQGRKCLLLCQQTGTLDITPQWLQMLAGCGIETAVLNTDPSRREKWIAKQLKAGVNVIISHPKKVETGLDLLEFPTIIWMGTEYSAYTVLQASRRSWRIGQSQPVKVYFFAYARTLQERALHLIASKVSAVQRINGDTLSSGDSLADLDTNSDILTALGRIALGQSDRLAVPSLQDAFSAANRAIQHANSVIGAYEMPEADLTMPEAEPSETQAKPLRQQAGNASASSTQRRSPAAQDKPVAVPTNQEVDSDPPAKEERPTRYVFGQGYVPIDELPSTLSGNGRPTLNAKRKRKPATSHQPPATIKIPKTRLSFSNLAEWCDAYQTIAQRQISSKRYQQERNALEALSIELCYAEPDETAVAQTLDLLKSIRPPRGLRQDHLTTPLIVALRNRQMHGVRQQKEERQTGDAPNGAQPVKGAERLVFGVHQANGQRRPRQQQPAAATQLALFG